MSPLYLSTALHLPLLALPQPRPLLLLPLPPLPPTLAGISKAQRPATGPKAPSQQAAMPCAARRYVADARELRKYAASLHLLAELPDALVVHNLSSLVQAAR